jgi:hypothetical protein
MRIVEPDQPIAVRVMQGEGVAQTVRTLRRRLAPFDLELQPIALFEVVDAAIKPQQELKCVLVRNRPPLWLSYHDNIL